MKEILGASKGWLESDKRNIPEKLNSDVSKTILNMQRHGGASHQTNSPCRKQNLIC